MHAGSQPSAYPMFKLDHTDCGEGSILALNQIQDWPTEEKGQLSRYLNNTLILRSNKITQIAEKVARLTKDCCWAMNAMKGITA